MVKKTIIFFCILLLAVATAEGRAAAEPKPPLSAGGFTLGTSIKNYDFISEEDPLKEVIINDIKGFRKGFVTYGVCDRPGEIVRIKLKYKDRSSDFFEQLLKQYKKKFGSKPKFIGDSFGNLKAWKWAFTGGDGKRITLVLQHNLKNADESMGNMVKLSLPDQLISERECSDNEKSQARRGDKDESIKADWDLLLPE